MKLINIIERTITGDWGCENYSSDTPCAVNCIRSADIVPYYNHVYNGVPVRYITESSLRTRKLIEGDIIIEKSGGTNDCSTGRPMYVSDKLLAENPELVCSNFCSAIRIKEGWCSKYVYYFLRFVHGKGVFHHFEGKTSGIHNLQMENAFSTIDMPDLSLEEQEKVADVLSNIENVVFLNLKQNETLEQMAKQLYDYWFVQFDFPDANGNPYKSSGGAMVYNEQLKREIPEGWEVKSIGECITTNRGHSYTGENLSPNGIPMINLASFTPNGKYNPNGIKFYEGKISKDKQLQPYDLVICNTQQTAIDFTKDIIGRALLVPDIFEGNDIISSHHVTTIKCNKDNLRFSFYYLFNSDFFHKYISKHTNGTNILGLIMSGLTDYKTFIPEESVLKPFTSFVMDIHSKMCNNIKNTSNMNAYFKELLPLLITGQAKL